MKVKTIMTREVVTCTPSDSMARAAHLMWDHDCGTVPVVNAETGVLESMVTDRDLCMASLLGCQPLAAMKVSEAMSPAVVSCHASDDLKTVHEAMREHQVRRLPVLDDEGLVIGLVSLNDLAVEAWVRPGRRGDPSPARGRQDAGGHLRTLRVRRGRAGNLLVG